MVRNGNEVVAADAFTMMDRLDDEAALAEMRGQVIKAYVYEFPQDGKAVRGLSKAGVDAVCRHLAEKNEVIREIDLDCDAAAEPGYALFRAKAARYKLDTTGAVVREVLLDTAFGVKRQPLTGKRKDGSTYPDPHWYEKGAMKACRNARRRLIPEKIALEMIAQFGKDPERVKNVSPKPGSKREVPPEEVCARAEDTVNAAFAHESLREDVWQRLFSTSTLAAAKEANGVIEVAKALREHLVATIEDIKSDAAEAAEGAQA